MTKRNIIGSFCIVWSLESIIIMDVGNIMLRATQCTTLIVCYIYIYILIIMIMQHTSHRKHGQPARWWKHLEAFHLIVQGLLLNI